MGYRSIVKICLKKETYEDLKAKMLANDNMFVGDFIKYAEVQELALDPDIVIIGWDWIKWYEGNFPEVDFIMDYLNDLEDAEVPFKFIRLGESFDDIEEREFYNKGECDHICPITDIDVY